MISPSDRMVGITGHDEGRSMAKKQHLSAKEIGAARTALMQDWETLSGAFQALSGAEKHSVPKAVATFYKSPSRAQAARFLNRLDSRDLKFLCRYQRKLWRQSIA